MLKLMQVGVHGDFFRINIGLRVSDGFECGSGGLQISRAGSSFVQKARSSVDSDLKVVDCASKTPLNTY